MNVIRAELWHEIDECVVRNYDLPYSSIVCYKCLSWGVCFDALWFGCAKGNTVYFTVKQGICLYKLEFASVVDAVRCAVDVQRELAERNADVPPDRRIELRMGINLGDISRTGAITTAMVLMSRPV